MIITLTRHKAQSNQIQSNSFTVHNDAVALAKILLDLKDKLSIQLDERTKEGGLTAFEQAKKQNNIELCNLLISHSPDANKQPVAAFK